MAVSIVANMYVEWMHISSVIYPTTHGAGKGHEIVGQSAPRGTRADQRALDFWEFVCASLELHGNAYTEVVRARNGRIIPLGVPITPELVTVRRLDTGALEYEWVDQGRHIISERCFFATLRGP
jgi:hypothetical protein